ncbi:neuromedin-U [Eulemur rufifrons]|uniref:neuromedin-U n=1 Tax=Eulemur rufifrons TaxID=859984 RepID=UPI003742D3E8
MPLAASRRARPPSGQVARASPLLLLLLLLACCAGACRGAPILPQGLWPEQELHLWKEIEDACLSFLSVDSQPQASKVLEELCFVLTGILLKPREQDEKDNTKRFLFHYSKTQKLGNSNVVSSVVHPLLQLVPQLNERRMKRFKVNEEFQTPFASRGYFLFRPRNGRRSAGFI